MTFVKWVSSWHPPRLFLEETAISEQMPESTHSVSIGELRRQLRAVLPHLREEYAVERLSVHGSRVRGEARPSSDLDILVDFKENEAGQQVSLLDFMALKHELEDLLGVPVDLGETKALRGPAAEKILRETEPV